MRNRITLLAVAIFFLLSTSLALFDANNKAVAVTASDWKAGRIIDDAVFTDKNAMSVEQIQAFLNSKVGTGGYDSVPGQCDTSGARNAQPYSNSTRAQYAASLGRPTTFTCLKNYYEVPKVNPGPGIPASNYGGAPIPAGARSAAQLIWDAAQRYNISPKVLLVTIQKESAGPLTTDDWPFQKQFTYAMGAHCPDSGPGGAANCDENYAGFSIQISESAELKRYYLDNMDQSWWPYKKLGNNNILYQNSRPECGSSIVNITTRATAALYTYTPYQPNQAALINMYSTGDACSAYGNRNFWRIFNDWFGSTQDSGKWLRQSRSTGKVYLVAEGYEGTTWKRKKFFLPTWDIIIAYRLQYEPVLIVDDAYLNGFSDEGSLTTRAIGMSYGEIQFMDNGNRYFIPNQEACTAWGFDCLNTNETKTIPGNEFLERLPGLGSIPPAMVSNGVAYRLESGKKLPILDGRTFADLGLSWNHIIYAQSLNAQHPLGQLQISHQVPIQFTPTSPVVIYTPADYQFYKVPNYETYSAWDMQKTSVLKPQTSSFTSNPPAPISPDLSIWATDGKGNKYLIDGGRKINVTASANMPAVSWLDIGKDLLKDLPEQNLGSAVQINGAVYILENGQKRHIPTYNDFVNLGLSIPNITQLSGYSGDQFTSGASKLADGSLFETTAGGVFVVDNQQKLHIPMYSYFSAFNLKPERRITGLENLGTTYPGTSDLSVFVQSDQGEKYIVINGNRLIVNSTTLQDWGLAGQAFQTLTSRILNQINVSGTWSKFMIHNNAIYYAEGGCKHHILSWESYQSRGGNAGNTPIIPHTEIFNAIPSCADIP